MRSLHSSALYGSVEEKQRDHTWPVADWFDHSVIADQIMGKGTCPIRGGGSEPSLIYSQLRGMEQADLDLALHPDIAHHCLDRLYDFCYDSTLRDYETIPGQVDFSCR